MAIGDSAPHTSVRTVLLALALSASELATAGHAQSPPSQVVAFVDVGVVPMDTERVLVGYTVVIKDRQIVAVGPRKRVPIPAEAIRIDGRGKYLIPGLADMHFHLKNADGDRVLRGLLAQGVTTIRNMDYADQSQGQSGLALRARAAAGELLSPRIYTAGPWMTDQDYSRSEENSSISWRIAPAEVAARIAAYKAAGYDFVKPYYESPEIFDSVVAAARRLGLPVAGHAPFLVSIQQALGARMRSIEHLTGYIHWPHSRAGRANASEMVADLRDETQRSALVAATLQAGTWNCPTLAAVENIFRLVPSARPESPLLVEMRRFVKALQDAGAGLLLGTDATAPYGNITVAEELQALTRAGLTPYQALVTGTRNVAAYFGTLDSTGTIVAGKRADLVLLNGNPLQDVQHVANPAGMMLGGRWRKFKFEVHRSP